MSNDGPEYIMSYIMSGIFFLSFFDLIEIPLPETRVRINLQTQFVQVFEHRSARATC
jgi:hypothetical protein